MAIRLRSPFFSKDDPARIISKIDRLTAQLTKSYTIPTVVTLRDGDLFQQIAGQMGWNTSVKVVETQTVQGQMLAYSYCPIVTAVVNKRNDMMANGRWCIEDKDGNEATKGNNGLFRIMQRPNPLQTWMRFVRQAYAFRDIFGSCYIMPVKPDGFGIKDAASVWVVPNWLVTSINTGKLFGQSDIKDIISGYRISGFNRTFSPDELIVWEDSTIAIRIETERRIEAQSRLYSLSDQVTNFQTAYAARRTLLEKRGALGAWVNNNAKDAGGMNPITDKERDKVLTEFGETYGIDRNKFPWLFTTSALKWEQAGFPTKDLMLFEEIKDTAQMIGDAYGISIFLLPWADQTTFTNLDKAEKRAYSTVTVPDGESLAELLTEKFTLSSDGMTVRVYFDHLEVFQKSKKDEADALTSMAGALSKMYREDRVISQEEYRTLISAFMPQGSSFDPDVIAGNTFFNPNTTQQVK